MLSKPLHFLLNSAISTGWFNAAPQLDKSWHRPLENITPLEIECFLLIFKTNRKIRLSIIIFREFSRLPPGSANVYRIAYSQKLQHFFSAIGKDFFKHQSAVFVRDFYDLLERSSFDVDLLYRHSSKKIQNNLSKIATEFGLFLTIAPAENGFLVFVVDFDAPADRRRWAYLEFHSKVESNCLKSSILFADITVMLWKGLPIPSEEWQLLS